MIKIINDLDTEIELPIFAKKEFLSSRSTKFGWFVDKNFILPFYINKKLIFSYVVLPYQTIYKDETLTIIEEKNFLNDVVGIVKSQMKYVDFIAQPPSSVVFGVYPDGCLYTRFGSYQIRLDQSEQTIFSNIHTKHRNAIKKAIKDEVFIKEGLDFKEIAVSLIKDTMLRQNMMSPQKTVLYKELNALKNNIKIYVAEKNGIYQGCAIVYYDCSCAYYIYGGSISHPYSGSLNLLHWQIIKDMKSKGIKIYDFVGARINPIKGGKLEGIQRFKSRFGGKMKVGYLWKYPIKPLKYKLFEYLKYSYAFLNGNKYIGDIIDQEIKTKTILLTFDYELFFGDDSGTLENSILKPTSILLDSLNKSGIKATFYIDTIYIERILDLNLKLEYNLIKKQIQDMVRTGHRVELHIHPHWYDAIYQEGSKKWVFPTYKHYKIQSYTEIKVQNIINKSVRILYDIIKEVDDEYRLHSYRAGGWCIQPFDKLKKALLQHKILVDTSVMQGIKSNNNIHYFDFTKLKNIEAYRFTDDVLIEDKNGKFIEMPIGTFCASMFFKIINKILLKLTNSKIYGDGKGINMDKKSVFAKLGSRRRPLSIDNMSSFLINIAINKSRSRNIIFISHPKSISLESIKCLDKIIKRYNFKTLYDMEH
ncbi:GNAT family N-acetyltransferase [Campylobacter curvus]|uniref:GNAT family N-acetyltransferase n=1 Tax=Campylobacter curvus TaxID=200 RepID=UPI000367B8FF|nr:polysaccharide deacetylase family protein [Campylobacter curvus]QKF61462.1 carbohydrate esterase 4 superfamily protein [Campylobacter curvus]UEB49771.1 peptidoglycan bridge formation glycyltransferase FemA/FemB family protein [Campylobacter curvus]